MRLVIQRVSSAEVIINKNINGKIGNGLLVLVGFCNQDTKEDLIWTANKLVQMRIFNDSEDKMNLSLLDIKGEILIISQFTLFANTKKGNRPGFINAAKPDIAIPLYEKFIEYIKNEYTINVATGIFGADMKVNLTNDGPVTIILDSKNKE